MSQRKNDPLGLNCSFCGKSQKEVKKLIAGPSVYICDECIESCNEIILEENQKEDRFRQQESLPRPEDIKGLLD